MRILLNTLIRDNYAFFDSDSKACLDLSSPGAIVEGVTPAIRRGILAGTIIDVDQESGIVLAPKQAHIQDLYLKHMGIERKPKETKAETPPPVDNKSAIDKLNEAQVQDEKVQASKGKAKNAKKKEDETDGVQDSENKEV